jgi:subtilisin family serine protease
MKVKAISTVFALMMFLTPGICAGQNDASQFADTERDYVPNEVIIKFKDEKQVDFNVFFGRHKTREIHKVFKTAGKDARSLGLNKVYRVVFQEKLDIKKICQEMSKQPNVVYAEPNYIGRFCATSPNDPSFGQQWALDNTGQTGGVVDADVDAPEAWDDTVGSENVVIAVIDTGIDYNHQDLANNIWINSDETYNGKDDDNNGYVDDVIGWDFVSAEWDVHEDEDPYPPDNDPMDGHGHGTRMAGIISAVGDNNQGISGMTWNCKLMAVRAGYRRTDGTAWILSSDAASATEYAADNGANVINLSWGFTSVSRTVEAAIEYAHAREPQGAVIVASVGNEDSETVIFPSSMDKVIAVGGTDDKDERAVWKEPQPPVPGEASNYGVGIDVAAPGKNILTTALGVISYKSVQGTSASTGFTSGLAALIWSHNPSFTNLEVREIIYSSADAGISSDKYIGRGRINADKALEITSVPHAEITNLDDMDMISENFEIFGTANGGDNSLLNYVLEYAQGIYPSSWIPIFSSTSPVSNGVLGTWDVQEVDNGKYTLKLTVFDDQGNYNIKERLVFIDKDLHAGWPQTSGRNSYCHPVVGDLDNDGDMEIVVGDRDKVLHVWNHDGTLVFEKTLDGRIRTAPVLADIDNDGSLEILAASEGSSSHDSKVYLFDVDGSSVDGWPQVLSDKELFVLSVGDLDGNGRLEVVAASSRNPSAQKSMIYIWCADGSKYLPTVWPKVIDLNMPPNTYTVQDYASTPVLADMDKDGDLEIIVSIPVHDKRTIYVWHHDGTEFSRIDETGDGYTVHCVVGDIDNDNNGDLEIVGTTENGRLLVWNHDASSYPGTWPNLTYGFSKPILADLDQDKDLEIIVENNNNRVYVYHHDGENMAGWPVQVEDIVGDWAWPPLVAGDVDGDRCPEILAAGGKGKMLYIWHSDGTELYGWPKIFPDYFKEASPVIGDLDNDGKVELFVSSNTLCALWDLEGDYKRQDMEWPMFQHDARHTGVYTLLCKGAGITLKRFAEEFGRTDCP